MTALDVFRRYAAADKEIEQLEEQIERREALATGSTARPLSPDSGSRGSGDASMRLLDYVANKEELQAKLDTRRQLKEADRACCIYLAETLLPQLAGIMIRVYIEGKGLKQTGAELGYSASQLKRLKRQAETLCQSIEITYWDGNHVPLTAIRNANK